MIRRIVYFFTVALHSFKRNFSITVGTVTLLGMAFFLYSAFLLGAWNVARMAERWIGQVRVIAFLKEETDETRARELLSEIRLMTGVEEADYIASTRRALDLTLRVVKLVNESPAANEQKVYLPLVRR